MEAEEEEAAEEEEEEHRAAMLDLKVEVVIGVRRTKFSMKASPEHYCNRTSTVHCKMHSPLHMRFSCAGRRTDGMLYGSFNTVQPTCATVGKLIVLAVVVSPA